jgi:phenylacetate-CoA ligase
MICSFFSLYMGSWGALIGVERLGATAFPFGAGVAGQTLMGVQWARDMKPTAFYGTPSYALHFADTAKREGIDPRSFGFRVLFFSGEPGAGIPSTKKQIEETFGAACIDMGSTAEMSPWMTDGECFARGGMHLWQDIVYTEVCDPKTFQPVPYGSEGTPVYTHLERTSQPMIRFVAGDLTRWTDAPCPCGRTYPRLPQGIYGRIDDMFIVRGENIYPSAIEDVLRAIDGFGGEFRVIISRREAMDDLLVRAEILAGRDIAALEREMRERLQARVGVRPRLELVAQGTLPRTEFKAKRVIDDRDLYRKGVSGS